MTNTTTIKQVAYEKVLPDFKRFAATKNATRPILRCVHGNDEYLQATDAHRAIRIKRDRVEGVPEGTFLYDLHTKELHGDKMNGWSFPEMSRLFPTDSREDFFIPYAKLKEIRDALKAVRKDVSERKVRNLAIHVEIKEGAVLITASLGENNPEATAPASTLIENVYDRIEGHKNYAKWTMNAKYLDEALLTASKLRGYGEEDGFWIKFTSAMRPITITDEAMYEIIILPIRTY